MSNTLRKLRIFAASPSDVTLERNRLDAVVDDLRALADHVGLLLIVDNWSTVVPDLGRPEQIILDQLQPSAWDIFIGIMWHRFGTPTHELDPSTSRPYLSGTEEEFRVALGLWRAHKRPRVVFYRCRRPIPPDDLDPDQYRLVKRFFEQFEADADHPGLYQTFDSTESFERLVRHNLTQILLHYSQASGRSLSAQEVERLKILNLRPAELSDRRS